jgi:hypothetical protein
MSKAIETFEDLDEASRLIERALGDLNNRRLTCETCGLKVQEDFVEYQVYQQLSAVVRKLGNLCQRLKTKGAINE